QISFMNVLASPANTVVVSLLVISVPSPSQKYRSAQSDFPISGAHFHATLASRRDAWGTLRGSRLPASTRRGRRPAAHRPSLDLSRVPLISGPLLIIDGA